MKCIVIRINKETGVAQHLYQDALQDLDQKMGAHWAVTRASFCEPDPIHPQTWAVDLAPLGGPYRSGFVTRAAALHYEITWIQDFLRRGGHKEHTPDTRINNPIPEKE